LEAPFSSRAFKTGISGADFADLRSHAQSFEAMTGYIYNDGILASAGDGWQIRLASIAGDFWGITGARAALGTLFVPETPPVSIVLSHQFFERHFAGDPGIVGKSLTLDGRVVTVSGVLAPDFEFLFPQDRPDVGNGGIDAYISTGPLVRSPQRLTL